MIQGEKREFGYAQVALCEPSLLFAGIADQQTTEGDPLLDVWMSHGDQVSQLPRSFKTFASTDNCPIAAMADEERQFYGLQFHPEVSHTRARQAHFLAFYSRYLRLQGTVDNKEYYRRTNRPDSQTSWHRWRIIGLIWRGRFLCSSCFVT